MRIGELARRAGTTARALRYYESRGLLSVRRDAHGHRTFGEDDLKLLRQIRALRDSGFELEETRPFVECLRAGHPAGDSCDASMEVYRSKLVELDGCIAQLQAVRDQVRAQLARAETEAAARSAQGPEPRCELAG